MDNKSILSGTMASQAELMGKAVEIIEEWGHLTESGEEAAELCTYLSAMATSVEYYEAILTMIEARIGEDESKVVADEWYKFKQASFWERVGIDPEDDKDA